MEILPMSKEYQVLAYYHLVPIVDPAAEVSLHKKFFEGKDITSRIYISEEGINGQMSASSEAAKEYMEWMHSRPLFKDVYFKIHEYHEQAFPRQTVKYRKHLVAHDRKIDLSERGEHLPPHEWKKMMDAEVKPVMLDIRNDYEWKLGHFEGAELPPCQNFREFEIFADTLREEKNPDSTPVMMYCTGGIRCEYFSAILKEKGFKKIYQLDGGVINYGLKEGTKHWLGKLFVFDDRLSVPISSEESKVIGTCHCCGTPSESYYNCASMDCNELFLSCPTCLKEYAGCCKRECQASDRVRPYHHQNPHKPFRKKHCYNGT
jgi:UPF0176 protein